VTHKAKLKPIIPDFDPIELKPPTESAGAVCRNAWQVCSRCMAFLVCSGLFPVRSGSVPGPFASYASGAWQPCLDRGTGTCYLRDAGDPCTLKGRHSMGFMMERAVGSRIAYILYTDRGGYLATLSWQGDKLCYEQHSAAMASTSARDFEQMALELDCRAKQPWDKQP